MSDLLPKPLIIVVLSLSITILSQVPRSDNSVVSSFIPISSDMKRPPVNTAMSSNIALRLSPKPGALTAATLRPALTRLTTSVASASLSKSSEIIRKGLEVLIAFSSIGRRSFIEDIFLS